MVGLASTVCETGAREALVAVLVSGGQLRLMKCYPTAREDQRETQDRVGDFRGNPGAIDAGSRPHRLAAGGALAAPMPGPGEACDVRPRPRETP